MLSATIVAVLHLGFLYLVTFQSASVPSSESGMIGAERGTVVEATLYPAPTKKPDAATQKTEAALPAHAITLRVHSRDHTDADRSADIAALSHDSSEGSASQASQAPGIVSSLDLGGGTAADLAQEFQRQLLAHIEPFLRYPDEAKAAHPQGVVDVVFAMDRNGTVIGAWIKQSSGSTALDREALNAIMHSQPLPVIPADLPSPLNIELPVAFSERF